MRPVKYILYSIIKCGVLLLPVFFLCSVYSNGQPPSRSLRQQSEEKREETIDDRFDMLEDSTHFEGEIEINSHGLLAGRTFGGKGVLISPKISFYHKYGIGFGIVNYSWPESGKSSSLTDLVLGYSHTFSEHLDLGIDYIYWIFHDSPLTANGLNNLLDATAEYSPAEWFTAASEIVFMFGNETGLLFHESASLNFKVYPGRGRTRFTVWPEAGFYFGNETIYLGRIRSENPLGIRNNLNMLDLYGLIEVIYQFKKLSLILKYENDFPGNYFADDRSKIFHTSFVSLAAKIYLPL